MKLTAFLDLYRHDPLTQSLAIALQSGAVREHQAKGLVGSGDAAVIATTYLQNGGTHLFVLHDREEAAYFHSDLQNLLPEKEILIFPISYKKVYQYEETENANVLMRAEVLNRINERNKEGELIVTYPEALSEKVINKRSLKENTFDAKVGEKVDNEFVSELLTTYGFEKTDFVLEAGQFAVRGGIIDIFSYANELPYRIELFGDEIESIRTFNPETQLSVDYKDHIAIIPNVQTRMLQEQRESFLEFIPKETTIWMKDVNHTYNIIGHSFQQVSQSFEQILAAAGGTKVISEPDLLFETSAGFKKLIKNFQKVEFGKRFLFKTESVFKFDMAPQPSFAKDFNRLAETLNDHRSQGISDIIVAESPKQIERLTTIFDEIDPYVRFEGLNLGLREGFLDKQLKVACFTDHQLFERYYRAKEKTKHTKSKALTLKELRTMHPGDYVTHVDYGIGRFVGMETQEVGGRKQEMLRIIYRDDDLLFVSVHSLHKLSKYSGKEGDPPVVNKLGSPEWENKKKSAKRKVKDMAKELIQLYAKRKAAPGHAFPPDGFLQAELESSFIYEDTPDQAKATADVKEDMEQPHPMDRLVCGDVGFGKTEVAIRAAFKAVTESKQAAVLVPTTILAMQHYKTFKERLAELPCRVEYINRFRTAGEIRETLKRVESGVTDILIGTHRIVSKDVKFKDLGLLIIDEEQKFGVAVKEKLKRFRVNVDVLTLTATPIPRTLHFSLMGARDLSVIATPPPNRQPVTTELHPLNDEILRDAISRELKRDGQVFFVHNRIADIDSLADRILRLVPEARIGRAHGQMDGAKLEQTMLKFMEGEYDVLVSTNIIESGLDIPNANTIMINRAHMFGLSDLHQMRGRVGRSNKKAYCYLLTPDTQTLTSDSRKRLSTLEEFSDLGDGFKVAMRDLDIRGAGNLLGGEQSGFITDLGFDMYHKILDEAVQELKDTEFRELFKTEVRLEELVEDCTIETDFQLLIPAEYVDSVSERLNLYSKLDNLKNEAELETFKASLIDRFGPLPIEVADLIETVRLRWMAEKLGFEKLILKGENMRGYFVPSENEAFYQSHVFGDIIRYIQLHPKRCQLKETKKRLILIFEGMPTIKAAKEQLSEMLNFVNQEAVAG